MTCVSMLRLLTVSLCSVSQRLQQLPSMHCSSFNKVENTLTVKTLHNLSVDTGKIRKLKGWVLQQNPVYVTETVALLRDIGAPDPVIAQILELYPEAILCTPEQLKIQKFLWMSVCRSQKDLVGIIEKFPASFFTSHNHIKNRKANILFFQNLGLNRRIVAKLMASAPQSFSRSFEQNEQMVQTLQKTYLDLGGKDVSMKVWLQKLLSQNPYVLQRSPEALMDNLKFLQKQGFSSNELLQLLSKLKGFITEVDPELMLLTWNYSYQTLRCSEHELREVILKCPALLYYSVPILEDRFGSLFSAGICRKQIIQAPTVLELTTHIVQYRIHKLSYYGYDIRTGSLELLNGTNKDFEINCGKFSLRRERPLFNPVAPLRTEED